ncbi:hypothetical protein D1007_38909 [Hordeum vulgare]|nr:hypothetical protein D1007_38909 [Hordeum vulgare]
MGDARRVRSEHRTTRIAQTAPVGADGTRRLPSPVANAATNPEGSFQPVIEQADGRTATPSLARPSGSASHARPEMPHGRCALAMATELLRYRPAPDCHDDWLQRIEELNAVAGDSAALSSSLRPRMYLANDEEQDAPPPTPAAHHRPRAQARSATPRPAS